MSIFQGRSPKNSFRSARANLSLPPIKIQKLHLTFFIKAIKISEDVFFNIKTTLKTVDLSRHNFYLLLLHKINTDTIYFFSKNYILLQR